MSLMIPSTGFLQLLKGGYKHHQGLDDVVIRNIESVREICRITRTSFGPNGYNKIILNHLEKLFYTSDAATIVKELDIVHPAVKVIVDSSRQQEAEMGDATNLVIVLAGELLKGAQEMFKMGLHVSEVIDGYRTAIKNIHKILPEIAIDAIKDMHEKSDIYKAVYAPICSKHLGNEKKLAELVSEVAAMAMPRDPSKFDVDSIRVVRILGGSIHDSKVLTGMVFLREPEGSVRNVNDAKIAIYSCPVDISLTETKGTVLIRNASDMLNFSKGEEGRLEQVVKNFKEAGINVVVTCSTVGDLIVHFMNTYGIMLLRVPSKFDLRRLCRLTGATALPRLVVPTPNETGSCQVVSTTIIGKEVCTCFDSMSDRVRTVTICIRGGTQGLMEDVERGVDDAVRVIKDITIDKRMLPGAGAAEMELAVRLRSIAEKTPGMDQYAMLSFSDALQAIPHIIADNSGLDATLAVSTLGQMHANGNTNAGIDINATGTGVLPDVTTKGILDSLIVKQYAIDLALHAAITILSIDQVIMSKPSGGPKPRTNPNWDED